MKKEILFSIVLGLSLGLILTFLVYRSRNSSQVAKQELALQASSTPAPSATALSNLVINSPDDESIVTDSEVTVAGTTKANIFVVVFINNKEIVTTADASGNFSVSGTLETGSNVITIHALNEDGGETVEERVVIYTSQSLESDSASPSASPKASTSPSPSTKATAKPTTKPTATP